VPEIGIPERVVLVKGGVWARLGCPGERALLLCRLGSGVVGHGGLAPGTLVRVEANRFGCLDIPSPRTTGVVGMERCGHSRAGLNHMRRPATWGSCRYCELAA